MNPQFPLYIISKGRADTRLTAKALELMRVPFYIVVEQQEHASYAAVIDPAKVLVLPQHYLDDYDTFWSKETDKRTGPGAARNFCWEHSLAAGAAWHWVMDDNIDGFYRLNHNLKVRAATGAIFRAAEDFCLRYENVAIAGFNYFMMAKRKDKLPPFVLNTRIYSCLLIRNDIPYRWRGRYNEDTDLSVRALKDGWCTVQFNAFLQMKTTTQVLKGGNTAEFYEKEGTDNKSQMLVEMHPDVSEKVWRFGRWHHHVDYLYFRKNTLIRKPGIVVPEGVNNYGMVLKVFASEHEAQAARATLPPQMESSLQSGGSPALSPATQGLPVGS